MIGLLRELRAGEIPRADSSLPVLVLGADDDSAGVRYYRAGADVALPSGSSPLLVAGLEALACRTGFQERRQVLRVGRLTVDCDARSAEVDGRALGLTRLEFDLLATLASQPRKVFSRARLTREVWGYDPQAAGPLRTVDRHAHSLRGQARAGWWRADGAVSPRRWLEAHAMSPARPLPGRNSGCSAGHPPAGPVVCSPPPLSGPRLVTGWQGCVTGS